MREEIEEAKREKSRAYGTVKKQSDRIEKVYPVTHASLNI